MRNNIFNIVICVILICSCSKEKTQVIKQGVSVELQMPANDKAEGISIRAFNSSGILSYNYDFATLQDVNLKPLPLPAGEYTLVVTSSTKDHFAFTEQIGTTTMEELFLTMKEPNSSPNHAHYGVAEVTSTDKKLTNATIKANRIFSELQITLIGLDDSIVKVEIIINNIAKGFYPAIQKLSQEYSQVHLGEMVPTNNSVKFPMLRMMPVVEMGTLSRFDVEIETVSKFIFHRKIESGEIVKMPIDATFPEMENGGIYTPEVDFEVFRPGLAVDFTNINGWDDGSENNGEILNPI